MSNIPTRKQQSAAERAATSSSGEEVVQEKAAPKSLAGRYRVREGYKVGHGEHDKEGRHGLAHAGEIVELTHEEALSVIRLTKDQKDAEGRSNGPAIETEAAYNARIAAQREHEEFLKALSDSNNLPT